jgi:hypothetical protein
MTFPFNTSIPAATSNPADDQPIIQTNFLSTSQLLAVDHVTFNNSTGGQHEQVTFNANNVPSPPVSPPVLFTNTVAGLPQLFFYSGDAAHSSNQYVASANGSTLLLGGIILKWGSASISSPSSVVSFPVAFPNNCFNVQATVNRTGANVAVAVSGVSTTGFTAYGTASASPIAFTLYYLAIGD